MAVIKPLDPAEDASTALKSLMLAALALPSLMVQPVQADDTASVQYSHYQEGARNLDGMQSQFKPIEVDSLHQSLHLTLSDDVAGVFNYTQDTWSGATPIATAPASAHGNRISTTHVMTGASMEGIHNHDDASSNTDNTRTITGASPYLYTALKLDGQLKPLITDSNGSVVGGVDKKLVHTMSSASAETRKQIDFNLNKALNMMTVDMGAGLSQERDFDSLFGNVGGHWDFNRKQTTLNASLSYTTSQTHAVLDHDAVPHIYEPYMFMYERKGSAEVYNQWHRSSQMELGEHAPTITGKRQDWGFNVGISQILNKSAVLETSIGLTRNAGYLSNPYKAVEVAFIDPLKQQGQAGGNATANYVYDAEVVALLEQRPDLRNQGTFNLRYVQHIARTDAAWHVNYRYFQDSWGIKAHTLESEWVQPLADSWTVSPKLRYYTQTAADFYTPYLTTKQGLFSYVADSLNTVAFDRNKLPHYYSSDARLAGYGTLSAGLTLAKQLTQGMKLELGYQYLRRASRLQWGGGQEQDDYADFNANWFNVALQADLEANYAVSQNSVHEPHHGHHHASAAPAPAGVMLDHLLTEAGAVMVGYRYMYSEQAGNIQHNGQTASDYVVINRACSDNPCYVRPTAMNMRMHMFDVMYAVNDRLNIMLMPQFVEMNMSMRLLDESPRTGGMDAIGAAIMHAEHRHSSSGLGDTEIHALVQLAKSSDAEWHLGVGLSLPTGQVDLKMRNVMANDMGFMDYGMQLGSGTWDFKPSLTYTAHNELCSWGAQLNGTKRLQKHNASGYALGDVVQSTLWASMALTDGISASLRGLYSQQGAIKGAFNNTYIPISPVDYPSNYGGRFADVAVGMTKMLNSATGSHLGVEWLQPLNDQANGYQLQRKGTWVMQWSQPL